MSAVLFALFAGVSAATWTVCLKLASSKIHPALGAIVITSAALVVNSVALLVMRARGHEIALRADALWLLVLAGVAASGVDIFGLLAYERGLRLTSGLIISGTSAALVLLIGFVFLREPATWPRLLAVLLIAGGILLLHAQGD